MCFFGCVMMGSFLPHVYVSAAFCHRACPLIAPQIDFVAHDDIPYSSAGSEDVYKHIKEAGEWVSRDTKLILSKTGTCFNVLSTRDVCANTTD